MLVFHCGFWDVGQAAGVLELSNEAGNSTIDRPGNAPPKNVKSARCARTTPGRPQSAGNAGGAVSPQAKKRRRNAVARGLLQERCRSAPATQGLASAPPFAHNSPSFE
jgi:hypothetical protein